MKCRKEQLSTTKDNEWKRIKFLLEKAFNLLIKNDIYLLTINVNERSLTHKYAEYLQQLFPEYNVDCEYNRNGLEIKKLNKLKEDISSDDTNARTVFPDIIVHQRGTKNNFIVIEAKKTNNKIGEDTKKLLAYKNKNETSYKYAVQLLFPVEEKLSKHNLKIGSVNRYIFRV